MGFHIKSDADTEEEERIAGLWKDTSKKEANEFRFARRGDHFYVPFECDLCVFRKIKSRDPLKDNEHDLQVLYAIRRIILDGFWSRATGTVEPNARRLNSMMNLANEYGFWAPIAEPGPLPSFDHCGYRVAVLMVLESLKPGRYASTHKQWETIRKIRTTFSSHFRASADANASVRAFGTEDGKPVSRLSTDPCDSRWFTVFTHGCKRRMGLDWRPDQAISNELMLALLSEFEARIVATDEQTERATLIFGATFCVICYVISLRGPEGLLLDLKAIVKHCEWNLSQQVIIALRGKVKGEHHERQHLFPAVNTTGSGIQVRRWIMRTILTNKFVYQRDEGPAFVSPTKRALTGKDMNQMFLSCLVSVYESEPNLFPRNITSVSDVEEKYNVFRSFRRGSDSRAKAMGVSVPDINTVNRWKTKEKSKGTAKPGGGMSNLYADVELLSEAFLRYTQAM